MKTSVEQLGTNKYKLTVEVEQTELGPYFDRTYREMAKQVRIPGFRPGKAPRQILDQRLGRDYIRSEALREGLPELYDQAVKEADLQVVAPPEIDVTKFEDGEDLLFEATVETRPTPELKAYTGLQVAKPIDEVTDEDVDKQVDQLRERFATLEVVERPIESGDYVQLDLETTRDGEVDDLLSQKDFMIHVGQEMVLPEVDEQLVGKAVGDELTIEAMLPERFGEDRAGQTVSMKVAVKEVKAPKLPELDGEFAQTVSEFDSIDELRSDIRHRLEHLRTDQSDATVKERVLDKFVEHGVGVELPDGMVDMEVDRQVRSTSRLLQSRGATIEQYLESENLDVDAWRAQLRPQAERNLTVMLGLQAVAEAEGLEVTDEDREAEIEKMATGLRRTVEEVKEMLSGSEDVTALDGDILRAKALDFLVERADITPEQPEEDA